MAPEWEKLGRCSELQSEPPEESGLRDARGGLRRSLARLFLPDAQVDSSRGTLTGPRGKGQTPLYLLASIDKNMEELEPCALPPGM